MIVLQVCALQRSSWCFALHWSFDPNWSRRGSKIATKDTFLKLEHKCWQMLGCVRCALFFHVLSIHFLHFPSRFYLLIYHS
jgi:predicted Co/Zn/Cd cation transporter (cation efflux family)